MSKPQVWAVCRTDNLDREYDEAYLIVARSGDEAKRVYMAFTDVEATTDIRAETAVWRPASDPVSPPKEMLGLWYPTDSIMAAYGLFPSEDWTECTLCERILEDESFPEEYDDPICSGCIEEGKENR